MEFSVSGIFSKQHCFRYHTPFFTVFIQFRFGGRRRRRRREKCFPALEQTDGRGRETNKAERRDERSQPRATHVVETRRRAKRSREGGGSTLGSSSSRRRKNLTPPLSPRFSQPAGERANGSFTTKSFMIGTETGVWVIVLVFLSGLGWLGAIFAFFPAQKYRYIPPPLSPQGCSSQRPAPHRTPGSCQGRGGLDSWGEGTPVEGGVSVLLGKGGPVTPGFSRFWELFRFGDGMPGGGNGGRTEGGVVIVGLSSWAREMETVEAGRCWDGSPWFPHWVGWAPS
ncbi:hypothetical protein QBC39DRAFT_107764 [Podospora conica]|nr:hypothetical protein QBC39DRAFT_107764 [Schizothecium conicum]